MPIFDMPLSEMRNYYGNSPKPADFDAYWDRALREVEESGYEYTLEPSGFHAPGAVCSSLWFTGVGGAKIHCKFLRPEHMEGKIPGILAFHGYQHHAGEWFERLPYVYTNKAVLVLEVRGQGGLSQDNSDAAGPSVFGHVVRGAADPNPDKLYYRAVYQDVVKAARILESMDFVDETRIGSTGKSQGGALALVCAALCPEIRLAAPLYPFLSDFRRVVELDLNKGAYEGLYFYFKKYDPLHEHEDQFYERMGYIDIQNFSDRIRAEVLWQTGLMDHTCPPSTQFAAYNKLCCKKQMKLYPECDHEMIYFANDYIFEFLNRL